MKRAEWQAVYAPRGDALERRVRQTLMQLEEKPMRARPKRMVWLAAALALALFAAVAVAEEAWEVRFGYGICCGNRPGML